MNREQILAILYEMAMVIGGEVNLHPLLTKTLQKLLYHTSFPCGMIFLDTGQKLPPGTVPSQPIDLPLELSIGDYELAAYNGKTVTIPAALLEGKTTLLEDPSLIKSLPCRKDYYSVTLRLPIDGSGVILLMAPALPATELPLTQIFQPIMSNLSKAILLCRRNEAYAAELIAEKNLARLGLERFRAALDTSADSLFLIDPVSMMFVDFNETAVRETQYEREELLRAGPGAIMPEEADLTLRFGELIGGKAQHIELDTVYRRKDGSHFPVNVRFTLLHQEGGSPLIIALGRDIAERKAMVARIVRLSQLYSVLSKVNEAIISLREPQSLYEQVCRIVVEDGGFPLSWIGLLDEDSASVKPAAKWGRRETGYLNQAQITIKDVPEGRGPTGVAIREKRFDICNDIEHDPRMTPWMEKLLERGFRSSAAFPLVVKGKVFGALNLYADEPFFFDTEKIQLLERLSDDISFAVAFMEQEKDRRRAEEALSRLSHRNELILTSVGEGIYGLDTEGNTAFVNPAAARMLGYSAGELIGKPGHGIFHHSRPDGSPYPEALCPVHRAFREGVVYRGETEVYWRKDGSGFPVEFVSNPIMEGDKVVGAVVAFTDITERKRAEEMLRKFQLGIERSGEAIFLTNVDGTIFYVNPAFEKIYGYSKEEALEKTPRILKSGLLSQEEYKEFWETILAKETVSMEIVNKAKDGRLLQIESSVNPVLDEEGKIIAFLSLQRDISDRKRLEEQVRQMQKMEAVGHLAGGVAHDFNNYLTVIQGYSELMARKLPKESPLIGYAEEIKNASLRAAGVTRQLLLFSRRQQPSFKPTSLNQVVTDMFKMLGRLIGEQFSITPELAKDLSEVKADTSHLEQVLMNLVVNARDAMPKGGIIVIKTENAAIDEAYCRVHADARPGNYVRLSVKDTGVGMDRDTLTRIFEPFFTTKGKGAGTGLGLSVVYGIVKQHYGWITVDTAPGQGSTFSIYLPVIPAREGEKKATAPAETFQGKGERILLVEDEEGVRHSTELMLQEIGFTVFSAMNVKEALDLFDREGGNFHLVFSDVVLPDGNGVELLDQLTAKKKVPVLLASGYTDEKLVEQATKEKGYPFLQKPYTFNSLLETLRKVLG